MKKIKSISKKELVDYLKSIGCISLGTIVGVLCYYFCLYIKLAIFGWNLGLLISPIVAGYVETYFAKKYLKETTGAVSAFILFLVTVIYGFILSNPNLGHNLITLGTTGIIIQAAFPTFSNYFLIVIFISLISYVIGFIESTNHFIKETYNKIYYNLVGKMPINIKSKKEYTKEIENNKEIDINNLGILFLTSHKIPGKKILKYKGVYEAKNSLKYDENENIKLKNYEDRKQTLLKNIEDTKVKTLIELSEKLKKDKCNGILEVDIQYNTIRKDKTNLIIQISISGTGIILSN